MKYTVGYILVLLGPLVAAVLKYFLPISLATSVYYTITLLYALM